MSEKGKTAMPESEAKRVLAEEDTGCLCLSRGEEPYGVPVSYAVLDGRIVFHCSITGRKLDFIRANPRVCFVVSRHPDRVKPHHPEEGCKYRFESVICAGKARIVEDIEERFELLRRFLVYFNVRLGKPPGDNPISKEAAAGVACVSINIEKMTGRRK
ncbi:MAG: pyridoxamine 5'-phosphate oxidase family protein [Elusimicrobia bacterium]|nr:pyridoxamine 5'-phosphate oxidase family protein [Elusimicrobiota bacterium]